MKVFDLPASVINVSSCWPIGALLVVEMMKDELIEEMVLRASDWVVVLPVLVFIESSSNI